MSRALRTVAFVDLCGYTAYTLKEGDAAAVKVVARFRSELRRIAQRRRVSVINWTGDGALLAGTDPWKMGACIDELVRNLAREPLAVRSGVATGPVSITEDGDLLGATVNAAARRCRDATPRRPEAGTTSKQRASRTRQRVLESLLRRPAA